MGDVLVLCEFCVVCGANAWLGIGKVRHEPPDWRLPRGLAGLAGQRADAPSEARGADGERAGRPRGSRRSGGAVGSVDYRNDKFADVGLSAARTASGQASRQPEIWRGSGRPQIWRGFGQHRKTNGGVDAQRRKTGDPKAAGCLCVMGDLNPQPAD